MEDNEKPAETVTPETDTGKEAEDQSEKPAVEQAPEVPATEPEKPAAALPPVPQTTTPPERQDYDQLLVATTPEMRNKASQVASRLRRAANRGAQLTAAQTAYVTRYAEVARARMHGLPDPPVAKPAEPDKPKPNLKLPVSLTPEACVAGAREFTNLWRDMGAKVGANGLLPLPELAWQAYEQLLASWLIESQVDLRPLRPYVLVGMPLITIGEAVYLQKTGRWKDAPEAPKQIIEPAPVPVGANDAAAPNDAGKPAQPANGKPDETKYL